MVRQTIASVVAEPGPARKLWITGHSLGGALATIAAAELKDTIAIRGVHTFGQPRLVDAQAQRFFARHFADRFFRFVNDDDLVTRIPPGYEHVGRLVHFDEQGNVQRAASEAEAASIEAPPVTDEEFKRIQEEIRRVDAAVRATGRVGAEREASVDVTIEGLFPSLSDHALSRYIAVITRLARGGSMDVGLEVERQLRITSESTGPRAGAPRRSTSDPFPVLLRLRDPNWKAPPGFPSIRSSTTSPPARCRWKSSRCWKGTPACRSRRAGTGQPELDVSVPFVGAAQIHRPPIAEKGDSALVGIIDDGIDVLHEAFRDEQGRTRILAVWNQRNNAGPSPKTVDSTRFTQDYGTLYLASEIDAFIGGAQVPAALRDLKGHGTHLASIAAGRGVGALADGMAPAAKIVFVIPHMKTSPGDPPSLGYSASHVDALQFLKLASGGGNRVLPGSALPIAVNVSLGMNAGAHDGSSTLEAAFDSITNSGRDPGYVIVKSAGNERGHGGHARVHAFQGVVPIQWDSSGQFRFQDYIEVWFESLDELEFTLVDPADNASATVSKANSEVKQTLGENFCHLRLTEVHADNGASRLVLTIMPQAGPIKTGRSTLKVVGRNVRSRDGQVDAWVERDDDRPVRFVPEEPEMTLSIPGTANTVVTVAACGTTDPTELTASSSFGPTRDRRPKPDLCAPGRDITAAAAGVPTRQGVREETGTSMAAPHVTGALALVMSHRAKQPGQTQHNARQLRAMLIRTARGRGIHNEGFGFGVLDAAKLFEQLR